MLYLAIVVGIVWMGSLILVDFLVSVFEGKKKDPWE